MPDVGVTRSAPAAAPAAPPAPQKRGGVMKVMVLATAVGLLACAGAASFFLVGGDEEVAATYRFALEHSLSRTGAYEVGRHLHDAVTAILKGEKGVDAALADAQIQARQALIEQAQEREEATPQPVVVATPEPETGEEVVITFASFFADTAVYRELAEAFHDAHPVTVKVRIPSFSGRIGLKEMASAGDCFFSLGGTADGGTAV